MTRKDTSIKILIKYKIQKFISINNSIFIIDSFNNMEFIDEIKNDDKKLIIDNLNHRSYNYIIQFPNSIGLNNRCCEIDHLILKNNLNEDELLKAHHLSVCSVSFDIFKQTYDQISKHNKFCIIEC